MRKHWSGEELRVRADTEEELEVLIKVDEALDLLGVGSSFPKLTIPDDVEFISDGE